MFKKFAKKSISPKGLNKEIKTKALKEISKDNYSP